MSTDIGTEIDIDIVRESFRKMREAKKEVMKIAFWSSLQLER